MRVHDNKDSPENDGRAGRRRPLADESAETVRDRRVDRTRATILNAFVDLLLGGTYDAFSASDVIERANVGRSTFYEHFENKDAVFRASLEPLLRVLASAVDESCDRERVAGVAGHFLQNRRLARSTMIGTPREVMVLALAAEVERRLTDRKPGRAQAHELAARLVAEAQIGLLSGWIGSAKRCSPAAIAEVLVHASATIAAAACKDSSTS